MHFKTLTWSIERLVERFSDIDPKPQYQRGEVWDLNRKQLLIDTILNGFDIPKIYFRHLSSSSGYKYDVADGQQRIITIESFLS